MKKEKKAKVGRPKLADNDLKMNSVVLCMMSLVIVLSLMIGGMFSLTNIGTDNLKGAASITVKQTGVGVDWVEYSVKVSKDSKVHADAERENHIYSLQAVTYNLKKNKAKKVKIKNLDAGYTYTVNFSFWETDDEDKITKHIKTIKKEVTLKVEKPLIFDTDKTSDTITLNEIIFNSGTSQGASPEEISVYRSTKKTSGFKKVATLNRDNISDYGWDLDKSFNWVYKYEDKNLKPETTYYYKVRGYYIQDNKEKEAFYGPYSSVKSVKTDKSDKDSDLSSDSNESKTTFTVIYNSNGGTGTMSNQYITYGKSTKLSENKFTKSGYTFAGWKAKRDSGTYYGYNKSNKLGWYKSSSIKKYYIYKDEQKVSKTTKAGDTVTMYAQWKKVSSTTKKTTTTTKKPTVTVKNPTNESLTLSCPTTAKVNQKFTCTTNIAGAKISVSSTNLASGYNTSFTTTKNDLTKQSKYTKAGEITVTVTKYGYRSVSKKVKIIN